jgi:multiple sugar transport system permease protein
VTDLNVVSTPAVAGVPSRRRRRYREERPPLTVGRVVLYVLLSLGGIIMILPFVWMLLTALKTQGEVSTFSWFPKEIQWGNFGEAMSAAPFPQYFLNSVILTVGSTALTLVFCTMAGYALAQTPIRGRKQILTYFIILLTVPFQIVLVPLFLVVKSVPLFGGNDILGSGGTGWLNSWWGLIVPLAIAPVYTFLARQFYVSLPAELADAARIDGLSEFGIFLRIMTPLVKPALITIGVFSIEACWNAFLWPLIVTSSDNLRPIQVGLAIFSQDPLNVHWPYLMAGALLATVPMILLFLVAQKRFVAGMADAALKG